MLVRCAAQAVLASPLMARRESVQMRSTIEANLSGAAASSARPTRDAEHALRIDPNDFIHAPARVDRKEALHDMGVAIAP